MQQANVISMEEHDHERCVFIFQKIYQNHEKNGQRQNNFAKVHTLYPREGQNNLTKVHTLYPREGQNNLTKVHTLYPREGQNNLTKVHTLPYRRTRFTPLGVKYLILDDFHFRIDPQIINYNGLSFHTSMGLPELGRAAARRLSGRPPGSAAATPTAEQPQSYDLNKSKSGIDGHMLVCNSRLFIETNFPRAIRVFFVFCLFLIHLSLIYLFYDHFLFFFTPQGLLAPWNLYIYIYF